MFVYEGRTVPEPDRVGHRAQAQQVRREAGRGRNQQDH